MVRYCNHRTEKIVYIVKREKGLVKVKYVTSGTTSWYTERDFLRRFERILE
jgi:hypothetical protein